MSYKLWAAFLPGGPYSSAAVFVVLILVAVLIAVLVLAVLVAAVLIVILILVLVIHNFFLQDLYLRLCRSASMPRKSGFILCFKKKSCQKP